MFAIQTIKKLKSADKSGNDQKKGELPDPVQVLKEIKEEAPKAKIIQSSKPKP